MDFGKIMKQASEMKSNLAKMEESLQKVEITGSSGGELVSICIGGKGEMRKLSIDKSIVDPEEVEVLEDLIVAAFNDAKNKLEAHTQNEMTKITGGMQLPAGFNLPF